jgi:hypothetical protein
MSADWLVTRKLAARPARRGGRREAHLEVYARLLGPELAAAAGEFAGSVATPRGRRL